MYQVQLHKGEDNTDMELNWNQIDWEKAEEHVNRLQIRIVKATLEQKWKLVKRLQYLLTNYNACQHRIGRPHSTLCPSCTSPFLYSQQNSQGFLIPATQGIRKSYTSFSIPS